MNICGAITHSELRERLIRLAADAGWTCWITHEPNLLPDMLIALTPAPDVILSDSAEVLSLLPETVAVLVHLTADANSPDQDAACLRVVVADDDESFIQNLHDCVNAQRFEQRFAKLDLHEPITHLPHHQELFHALGDFQARPMGLMILQIDHAEHLYENLDPVSKTDLLDALAEHVKNSIPENAELGFYNVGCFVAAIPETTSDQLQSLANAVVCEVRRPLCFRGGEIQLTVSIGCNQVQAYTDFESLWAGAWQAVLSATHNGGDRSESAHNPDISQRLPDALERDEFTLVLQAQWNPQASRLSGVEVLLRWQGMEIGELSPNQFIPIAEKHGFMTRIGDWVMEQACREASIWFEHLIDPMWLCVNVSTQQFVNRAITTQIARLRKERWLDPGMLELEMSLESLLHLVDCHREQLYTLRDWGVRFAIDNLGKTLIDADKLLRCPADTLKIDRGLSANMESNPATLKLIEQICDLGERFGLRVVAVGVESDAQLALLSDFGNIDIQGYLISPPVPRTKSPSIGSELMPRT